MTPSLLERAQRWARAIQRDLLAVWLAARDRRTPWLARLLALIVAAYALSPIDLIPDFVPVLGYLDDLVVVPLGLLLVVRMIPPALMAAFRAAAEAIAGRPASRIAAAVVIALWIAGSAGVAWWMVR